MPVTRRTFLQAAGAGLLANSAMAKLRPAGAPISIILAPSNLGLRPPHAGHQPGTWQAPHALLAAGLAAAVGASQILHLARPVYSFDAQQGPQVRNGRSLRAFSLQLARAVGGVLARDRLPLVIGGDCSILLGCLYGLRRTGGRGLVHIDGHSDFRQLSASYRLGSAAGMDLALASGRGEALLTRWPITGMPLARDEDIAQIGERYAPSDRDRIPGTGIAQITAQRALAEGMSSVAATAAARLAAAGIHRAWIHVDLDVLDQRVMAAVDSPGSPGLSFEQLGALIHALFASGRIAGVDFAIYDPELDPGLHYAHPIVRCIARAMRA